MVPNVKYSGHVDFTFMGRDMTLIKGQKCKPYTSSLLCAKDCVMDNLPPSFLE